MSDDAPLPEIAEFEVRRGKNGMLLGRHKKTGREIEGETADELKLNALAVRVMAALTDPRAPRG